MKLILFDIDGTLIWPDGAGRAAMNRALIEMFGTAGPVDSLPMAGKTDWQILTELLIDVGLDPDTIETELPACFQAIAHYMARTTQERQVRVCPGVPGNLATTTPIKLRAARLNPALFHVGAYGSDRPDRAQLPGVALARAQALTGLKIPGKNVVIVGDTPADITCGEHLGVTAIGVATGRYSLEELNNAGADQVFNDLTNIDAVVAAIT
jgi:phosphoglycolate phosphatase-like HAD superfamily hydrolase